MSGEPGPPHRGRRGPIAPVISLGGRGLMDPANSPSPEERGAHLLIVRWVPACYVHGKVSSGKAFDCQASNGKKLETKNPEGDPQE